MDPAHTIRQRQNTSQRIAVNIMSEQNRVGLRSARFQLLGIVTDNDMQVLIVNKRLPLADVIRPKLRELMSDVGLPHCGLFNTLIASTRNSNSLVSLILTRLARFISRPSCPGPQIQRRPRLPTNPGDG